MDNDGMQTSPFFTGGYDVGKNSVLISGGAVEFTLGALVVGTLLVILLATGVVDVTGGFGGASLMGAILLLLGVAWNMYKGYRSGGALPTA